MNTGGPPPTSGARSDSTGHPRRPLLIWVHTGTAHVRIDGAEALQSRSTRPWPAASVPRAIGGIDAACVARAAPAPTPKRPRSNPPRTHAATPDSSAQHELTTDRGVEIDLQNRRHARLHQQTRRSLPPNPVVSGLASETTLVESGAGGRPEFSGPLQLPVENHAAHKHPFAISPAW